MGQLQDAEYAYKQQRAAAQLWRARQLRTAYRRAHQRAEHGSDLAKVRLKALRDELVSRGQEPPRV